MDATNQQLADSLRILIQSEMQRASMSTSDIILVSCGVVAAIATVFSMWIIVGKYQNKVDALQDTVHGKHAIELQEIREKFQDYVTEKRFQEIMDERRAIEAQNQAKLDKIMDYIVEIMGRLKKDE